MPNQLMKYLPGYYKTSKVMANITEAQDVELASFRNKLDSIANQFFIDTADFTLERWEKELGIPVDNSKPADYRRSVIKSKMRGIGTVKVSLIAQVAESYTNGLVDVIEHPELGSFTIKFISIKGIPPNLDDLKAAIEEIKPAHLAVEYQFTYTVWDELDSKAWTWDMLDSLALTWGALEVFSNA